MTVKEEVMKLQTYKMFEGEDTVYVNRDDILELLEQEPCDDCVSRQAVLDCLKATKLKQSKKFDLIIEIRNEVMMLPPVVLKSKSDVLDKIIAKIEDYKSSSDNAISEDELTIEGMKEAYTKCIKIINECKSESEE